MNFFIFAARKFRELKHKKFFRVIFICFFKLEFKCIMQLHIILLTTNKDVLNNEKARIKQMSHEYEQSFISKIIQRINHTACLSHNNKDKP